MDSNALAKIKETDLVGFLSALGFEPAKPSRNGIDFYYLSPLRTEGDPSFHVNRKKNQWFDHGLGKGGNIVDFGMAYFGCTVAGLPGKLGGDFSLARPVAIAGKESSRITILNDRPLISYPLIQYLRERHIPIEIARQYCREVDYELDGKKQYGIGFKNDSGGYEIRNPYLKLSSSPKDITVIGSGGGQAEVFEGFIDFLSHKTLYQNQPVSSDHIILNSTAFFEKARPVMEQHQHIRLWLDRDTTGIACTKYALSLNKAYQDQSDLYRNHKDLNDWLVNKSRQQKKTVKLKVT
jgi:hypothetical protein